MYRAAHASGEHTWPRPRFALIAATAALAVSALAGVLSVSAHAQPAEALVPAIAAGYILPERVQSPSLPAAPLLPATVSVRHGDTLSALSKQHYGTARYWYFLAVVNRIASHPDAIVPGEHLWFPAHPHYVSPPRVVGMTPGHSNKRTSSLGTSRGGWPGGAFGACVVARESGGNAQVMNSSGHYGLYQFSLGTWEAYGGSAALFGHASVAYQEQVFMNALARGGQSNWSPYDGC